MFFGFFLSRIPDLSSMRSENISYHHIVGEHDAHSTDSSDITITFTSVQAKIEAIYKKKLETGYDYNAVLQSKKKLRNPSIYEKLIIHSGIDEFGEKTIRSI